MSVQTFFDSGLITQIIYLNVAPTQLLEQKQTDAGSKWSKALGSITDCPGFVRLYWGRRLEEPEKVQLHLGWFPCFRRALCPYLYIGISWLRDCV